MKVARIIYIGGYDRSGSTLLGLMLGELPGVVAVGELRNVWERGVRDNELCGCGRPFHECPFWEQVGARGFGGWDAVDLDEVIGLRLAIDRLRRFPGAVAGAGSRDGRRRRYAEYLRRLYASVTAVSGADVIVDASKAPVSAYASYATLGLDLRLLHLVRDSRGVAYSWMRRVQRPEARRSARYMPRLTPAYTAATWMAWNSAFHVLTRRGVPTMVVRYEDLIHDPRAKLAEIGSTFSVPADADSLQFISDHRVTFQPQHLASGNPMRLSGRDMVLRLDDEWRVRMRDRDRRVVTAITAPLLTSYGYPLVSPRGASGKA